MSGMNSMGDMSGFSLLELFKLEAEAHCEALGSGLLALERNPADAATVEPLMRAAHSIKGAARIVGLDVIVSLAHAMEDRFVTAQRGTEPLASSRVDQLLQGVDILNEVRALAEADLGGWSAAQEPRIAALVAALAAPLAADAGTTAAALPSPAPRERVAAQPPGEGEVATPPSPADPSDSDEAADGAHVATPPSPALRVPSGHSLPPFESPQGGQAGEGKAVAAAPTAAAPAAAAPTTAIRVAASSLDRMLFLASAAKVEAARLPAQRTERERFEESTRRVEELADELYAEVLKGRMRPFAEGVSAFPRMVRDLSRELGKSVDLRIEGEHVPVDRDILQKLESPLTHMLRNSLDHGIEPPADRVKAGKRETATITLAARHQGGMLVIEIRDDGRGIDPELVRRRVVERKLVDEATAARLTVPELMDFLFLPGFSTKQAVTEISGRGVGLDVVQSMVHAVSGAISVETQPGRGLRFLLRLPVTLSVVRAAIVDVGEFLLAFPLARLGSIVSLAATDATPVQGRLQFTLDGASIGLVHAGDLLESRGERQMRDPITVLVIGAGDERSGLIVDRVLGEEDLAVRPVDPRLGVVPHLTATAVRADGSPVLMVDVEDVVRTLKQSLHGGRLRGVAALDAIATRARRRVLVVDDSITVREVERQLLLRRGFDVDVAVDGKDGYNALRGGRYDLLVTDVDMPRMNGIELVRALRREQRFAELPVVIVSYKDREEDRRLGFEVGANAYLTKSSFQDDTFVRTIDDLIGAKP